MYKSTWSIDRILAMVKYLTTEAKNVQLSEDGNGVVVGEFTENHATTTIYYEDHMHVLEYKVDLGLVKLDCELLTNKIIKYYDIASDNSISDIEIVIGKIHNTLFKLVEIDAERIYNERLETEKKRKIFDIAVHCICKVQAGSSRYKSEVV